MSGPAITTWRTISLAGVMEPWSATHAAGMLIRNLGEQPPGSRVHVDIGVLRVADPALINALLRCGAARWSALEISAIHPEVADEIGQQVTGASKWAES